MNSYHKSKMCTGLSVEGELLKIATLAKIGRKIRILNLASIPVLVSKFANTTDDGSDPSSSSDTGFDLDQSEDDINYKAVRDFLQSHFKRQVPLAVSYGEPIIRTLLLTREAKEKSSKTLKVILDEIQHVHNIELAKDMVDWVLLSGSSVLATARLEVAPLLDVFANPTGHDRRPTRIGFVTSNDIALLNMVRIHFRFKEGDITHVIHVNSDETKVYILLGNDVVQIAPVIMQGSRDRDISSLLLTRIELATDSAGYPTPNQIVLSGHAERIGLRESLSEIHPEAAMHSLSRLRIVSPADDSLSDLHDYILPISAAWQYLDAKNPHFYRVNVMPSRLREDQNKFKLAWHGFLLLLILFAATTGLTMKGLKQQAAISELKSVLAFEKQQIKEQTEIVERIKMLEARSADVLKATNTLDTLLNSSEKWSMTLDTLSQGTNFLKSMWISEMKPTAYGVNVSGFSMNRSNIPTFATLIGGGLINELSVQMIGKKKVFRYAMDLHVRDLPPYSTSRASVWHNQLTIPNLNNVTASAPTQNPPAKNNTAKGGS